METELQRIEVSRSMFKSSCSISNDHDFKYTSLKDILSTLDTRSSALAYADGFNSPSITIRNQLVKHAASAYLQSAAILAARDQNWLTRLCRRARRQLTALMSGWRRCVEVCAGFLVQSVREVLACMRSQFSSN